MSVSRHDGLLVDMVNESIEEDYNITCDDVFYIFQHPVSPLSFFL